MKRACAFSFVLSYVALVPAQNLVPNGSFEEYTECPDIGGQIERASNWVRIQGTPEYYNSCAVDPAASVPNNKLGYQAPHASGEAYAGIITYSDSDWFTPPELLREIIGIELTAPLIPSAPVNVSFWVSPGAFGMLGAHVRWTCSGVGLRFTFTPLVSQWGEPAANDADLHLQTVLLDTAGWTLISGTFVPDSAYDAIVIGNFVSDSLVSPYLIDSVGNYGVGYAYVDDVVVSYVADGISTSTGTKPELVAWYDETRIYVTASQPVPFPVELSVLNSLGSKVAGTTLNRGVRQVEMSCHLPCGVYWVVATSTNLSLPSAPLVFQTIQ